MAKPPKQTIQQQVAELTKDRDDMLFAMNELAVALRGHRENIAVLEAGVIALVRSGATDVAGLHRAFEEAKDAAEPIFHPGLDLTLQDFLMRLEAGREG